MNLVLFKGGYPPVTIRPEERPDCIDGLELRQLSGDSGPFETLMLERLDASLDDYLGAIAKELDARPGGPEPMPG